MKKLEELKLDFKLDPWQVKFLETKGDKILCCGRQIGKSVVCGIDAGQFAVSNKNSNILIIAPTERQAFALFDKTLKFILDNYKSWVKKGKDRPTKSKISLNNGTIIWCLPAGLSGIGIRFMTVHRLYEDEDAYIPEDVQTAVQPMLLTTGGATIKLSTPRGADNDFYNTFANKDGNYNSFTRFSYGSEEIIRSREICETWTVEQRDKALDHLRRKEAIMTKLEYAQEYLGKPLSDLRQVFPDKLLKECMVLKHRDTPKKRRKYYLGVDVAGMGKDESTFEILEKLPDGRMIHVEHQTTVKTRTTDTTLHIRGLNKLWNFKKMYIDSGGLGVGVCDQLRLYNDTKRKVVETNNASRVWDRDSSGDEIIEREKKLLKEELYNNLLNLMERRKILLLRDNDIFQSLKSVQFEIKNGKVKYSGNNTHIAEGLIRAAWGIRDKTLNIWGA